MMFIYPLFFLFCGMIIGSFVNVLVVRLPLKESIAWPRSHCRSCNHTIAWTDNLPVVSYFVLQGKCRHCSARFSVRYPIIELICGVLFLASGIQFGGFQTGMDLHVFLRTWPFLGILLAVTFIDLEHRIIPDALSLGGLALGLVTSPLDPDVSWIGSLFGAGLGFGLFYLLAWIYERLTHRQGLGGGDIKLLSMIGAFLGPSGIMTTLLVGSVFGSVVGIFIGIKNWQSDPERLLLTAIPFGPFLVLGAIYHFLLGGGGWFPNLPVELFFR